MPMPSVLAHTEGNQDAGNRLLAQLSEQDFEQVTAHLVRVPLLTRQVLHKQGEELHHIYFPNAGVVSMMNLLPDGTSVEAATIGNDGVVGGEAFFSDRARAACETVIQVPAPDATAERMNVRDFRQLLVTCPGLNHAVGEYLHKLYAVMARVSACNARHSVCQRCARWLLTTHDRMHRSDFELSQEFLSMMLGVRRQTVSVIAGDLRSRGLIDYVHGRITIRDRRGLEDLACSCYSAIRALSE